MIAEFMVRFYDKPRNRFICFLGALVIYPVLSRVKKDLARMEQRISSQTIMLGRLELTAKLLSRWWER